MLNHQEKQSQGVSELKILFKNKNKNWNIENYTNIKYQLNPVVHLEVIQSVSHSLVY